MRNTYVSQLRLLGVLAVPKSHQHHAEPKRYIVMRYPNDIEFCWESYGFADVIVPLDVVSLKEILHHSRQQPKLYIGFIKYYETE